MQIQCELGKGSDPVPVSTILIEMPGEELGSREIEGGKVDHGAVDEMAAVIELLATVFQGERISATFARIDPVQGDLIRIVDHHPAIGLNAGVGCAA